MPYRKIILAKDQIYHVYNRGVARLPIFFSQSNYSRLIQLIDYYRFANTPTSYSQLMKITLETRNEILKNLKKENDLSVEILAFCLMPNHFHFLLKQLTEKGIFNFMRNLQNSYVKHINITESRVGPMFQSAFKAKRIETEEQLLHVQRYIHLNPSTDHLVEKEKLEEYQWSSLLCYLNEEAKNYPFVNTDLVLSFFKNKKKYKDFVYDQADYQQKLALIKHLTLE